MKASVRRINNYNYQLVESGLGRVFWLEVIGSLGFCIDTRVYCPALVSLGGSLQNIFSSPNTISLDFSPSPSKQAGRQPCHAGSPVS